MLCQSSKLCVCVRGVFVRAFTMCPVDDRGSQCNAKGGYLIGVEERKGCSQHLFAHDAQRGVALGTSSAAAFVPSSARAVPTPKWLVRIITMG